MPENVTLAMHVNDHMTASGNIVVVIDISLTNVDMIDLLLKYCNGLFLNDFTMFMNVLFDERNPIVSVNKVFII